MPSVAVTRTDSTPPIDMALPCMESAMGRNIRAGRLRRDLSVADLSRVTQLATSRIEEYEAGGARIPAAHLVSIIDALDMRLSEVFGL